MINVDTNILVRALAGTLNREEAGVLSQEPWGISAIVLWELERLHQRGRLRYSIDAEPLATLVDNVHVWPLSQRICLATRNLDFPGDPADQLIAATSIVHQAPLVTRDMQLLRSDKVPLALR